MMRAQAKRFTAGTRRLIVGQGNRIFIDKDHQFDKFITFGYDVLALSKPFECDDCAWNGLCAGVWEEHINHGAYRWPRSIVLMPDSPTEPS
jgi:hypothetical protein